MISIRKKNAMFRTHFIKGNLAEKTQFRLYSNTLTRIKALSKKIYFCSEFARNKKNPRKTWEIIRSALPCKPNREPPGAFKETQDPNVIANQFNDYFCSIGSNLADSIICTTRKQPKHFLEKKVSDSIYLEPPTNNEILNQIISLKNKIVGHDKIQPFFIKVPDLLSPHISTYFLTSCLLKVFFLAIAKLPGSSPSTKPEQKTT